MFLLPVFKSLLKNFYIYAYKISHNLTEKGVWKSMKCEIETVEELWLFNYKRRTMNVL